MQPSDPNSPSSPLDDPHALRARVEQLEQGIAECRWARDILLSKSHRRTTLQARQACVLELLATEQPLSEVLQTLVLSIEEETDGMLCSVLLLDADGKHLRHGAAPSLPHKYVRAIDGVATGPAVGSCGTAAFTGRCVVVEDISTDPLWAGYRGLALESGLRACWSQPILSSDGGVLGTFAMYYRQPRRPSGLERDLTAAATRLAGIAIETRRVQEALARHRDRLEELVDERTAELKAAKEAAEHAEEKLARYARQLQERNRSLVQTRARSGLARRAKSRLLTSMSHEMRLPMTSILGYCDILRREGDLSDAPPARLEAVETIRRNGQHLLAIMNDALDLARLEAGKMSLESVACSPIRIAREIVDLLRPRAEHQGLTLGVEFNGLIPQLIQTDPSCLRRILLSVLANAIELAPSGEIQLAIGMTGDAEDDECILSFRVVVGCCDLDDEQIHNLFEPFSLARARRVQKFGITGLGLTISRWMAQLLGGDIVVRSVSSPAGPIGSRVSPSTGFTGCTFEVTIDPGSLERARMMDAESILAEDRIVSAAEDHVATHSTRSLEGLRILVADDTPDNQRLITHLLQRRKAEVEVVTDGRDAVERAMAAEQSEQPFDVILMDIQMPDVDGYSATRCLRERGYERPIIALTAHALPQDRQRSLDVGMDDHLTKPIDPGALFIAIRRVVPARIAPPLDAEETIQRMGGSSSLLLELIDLFLDPANQRLPQLRDAVERDDVSEVPRLAYALRGSAANFSAVPTTRAAHRLECLARDGDVEGLRAAMADLEREMARLQDALGRLRRQLLGGDSLGCPALQVLS